MDWYQKGIVYFADLLDANGNLLSFTNFCEKYQIRQSSYLKYFGLASAIPHHWKFRQNNSHNDDYVLVSRKQVYVKILGKVLNANLKPQACLYKWQRLFGEGLDFVYYFKLPFIITQDSKLRNFQYRLLNRITTTNKFLKLRNVVDTDKCTFCMMYVETLVHLFYECNHVALFWSDVESALYNKCNITVTLTPREIIFGLHTDSSYNLSVDIIQSLNYMIILAKKFIFSCRYKEVKPAFKNFCNYLEFQRKIDMYNVKVYNTNNLIMYWDILSFFQ